MRILFMVPYLAGGGAERVISVLANELDKKQNISILVFYRVEDEYEVMNNVKIHSICEDKKEYKKLKAITKIKKVRKYIKEIKPDVIIPFIEYVGMIANLANVGNRSVVIETVRNNPKKFPNTKIMRIFRNLSILKSKLCIVQNKGQLDYFSERIQKKCRILNNPIKEEFFVNKKEFRKKEIKKIIVVGRLEIQKNHMLLIRSIDEVYRKYKFIQVDIYGDGVLEEELNREIKNRKLSSVIKINKRTNNIIEKLVKSDLFILTSNEEGMPNALMEAMALGLPCISTDCEYGPSEIIDNENNGILINTNDEAELVKKIEDVIENPKKYIQMGKEAKEKMKRKYRGNIIGEKLMEIVEEAVR